ncbi:NtaA/DmoA family FMN-dependent monooxygenase [Cellulomonas dongxiuzhuiae]|uniref:NtaA/DmoA family FMN-dependent monooxygenase n=1 Tax=Cellulomonas dongxiuzhuiae TaxID=2819979 RepID=UPI001AAF33FA|nr:NtaA/DmoA family FMN-dependent monooxygenase [Cellulomonas dongxiuzhuiae]MBO3089601.1 NtaA/DmoA family FMN-dependent monooxygenase [Cellulomonas dongxiuzhuiae]
MHMAWFLSYAVQAWGQPWAGRAGTEWVTPDLYVDAARSLERAGFDYLMFEDGSFVPDAYGSSMEWSLAHAAAAPKHDPLPLVSLIAQETERIGLIATITTSFYPPYLAARLLATLDHLSRGRIGVNVVTSHNDRTAQNYGQPAQLDHDLRYEIAADWLEAVRALWDTWEPGALTLDETTGTFADPQKVHYADYVGTHHRTRGPLNTPPGPQHHPVVCQAGGSPAGRDLAARYADTVVAQARDVAEMTEYKADLAARAAAAGRDPDDVKVLFLAGFTFGDTDDEARTALRRKQAYAAAHPEVALASLSFASGIDFARFDLDAPLPPVETNAAQSVVGLHLRDTEGMTLREIAARRSTGAVEFTGTPASIADAMEEAAAASGADGFMVQAPITRRNVTMIADGLAPELRRRGLIRDGYDYPTLRENLLAG